MNINLYRLNDGQFSSLLQAQSVLSLLSKLSADVVRNARIHADELAAVAGFASQRMQQVLTELGSPTYAAASKEGAADAC